MGENSAISWTTHTFNPWWGIAEIERLRSLVVEACDIGNAHIRCRLDAQRHIEATAEDERIRAEAATAMVHTEAEIQRLSTIRLAAGEGSK